jgi:hypothetical protein
MEDKKLESVKMDEEGMIQCTNSECDKEYKGNRPNKTAKVVYWCSCGNTFKWSRVQ